MVMYGSEKTDLIVKYYDLAFGISGKSELAWYLRKVQSYGGPVLDLACGTGRLAILIAKAGFEVTAIDQSNGMLNVFKKKHNILSAQDRARIWISKQSMQEFKLENKFNTIICCDSFFHNLTVDDEIKCLEHVSSHLAPGGHFVFNLPNPSCDYIQKCAKSDGKIFNERGKYLLEGEPGFLLVEEAQAINEFEQRITTRLRFTLMNENGVVIEKGESSWISRYLFQYEAIHLMYRCGFSIHSLVGDYKNGEVSEQSQLIFDVKLNEDGHS